MRVRFGECVLDCDLRELTRAGKAVPLLPKVFCLLEALIERRPRAVSQAELRGLIWTDVLAGGTRLARLVSELRVAIGDVGRPPRFIRTVHRFGYAFCGSAEEECIQGPRPANGCALQWGDRLVPLTRGENLIGRAAEALISVASAKVSRRHARIVVAEGRATLEDLDSRNGTYVRDRRIDGVVALEHGDPITVGPVLLIFCAANDQETVSTNHAT